MACLAYGSRRMRKQLKNGKQSFAIFVGEILKFYRFRNVKAGEPFDEGCLSADYNRHVQFGYEYYLDWKKKHDLT